MLSRENSAVVYLGVVGRFPKEGADAFYAAPRKIATEGRIRVGVVRSISGHMVVVHLDMSVVDLVECDDGGYDMRVK